MIETVDDCNDLQTDLDSICHWCKLRQMKLNPSKCEVLCNSNKHVLVSFISTSLVSVL